MYKFRSMVQEAEELLPCLVNLGALSEPVYKLEDDPRVTRVGGLLRRTSVDELPQLFNVLKGDMSIVGPRPLLMKYMDRYTMEQMRRHDVNPGITGWAQVNGLRGDSSIRQRVAHDLYYIENWSIGLDIKILWRTLRIAFHEARA